jgi:signal transduction histidine kinase
VKVSRSPAIGGIEWGTSLHHSQRPIRPQRAAPQHTETRASSLVLQLVAHELASPLTALACDAQTLACASGATGVIAQGMYEQTLRLIATVTNLLDSARIGAGANQNIVRMSADRLANLAISLAADEVPVDAVSLETFSQAPRVAVDVPLATRAIANVIRNGARHGAPPVTVRISGSGAFAILHVEDAGPGIAASDIADLFQPFRPFGARSRTGLGLWLARELVRQMGGDLELSCAEPTCFTFSLPIADPEATR